MASPTTKFTVGLFIAGGMGIALLAFIWLGMSHFLEKGTLLASGTNHSFSQLQRHLLVVAQNLGQASENLNRLIELLADHPSQSTETSECPGKVHEPSYGGDFGENY